MAEVVACAAHLLLQYGPMWRGTTGTQFLHQLSADAPHNTRLEKERCQPAVTSIPPLVPGFTPLANIHKPPPGAGSLTHLFHLVALVSLVPAAALRPRIAGFALRVHGMALVLGLVY